MRYAAVVAIVTILGAAFWMTGERPSHAEPAKKAEEKKPAKPDRKVVKELMGRKLEHSQKLLSALVLNDLPKAARECEQLIKVRKEAAWFIVKTSEYELWSKEFSDASERILKAAKDNNLDTAKLAYLELTLSCFHCHTYVRDLKDIRQIPTTD